MPVETVLLAGRPAPLERCPNCGTAPFDPFLRGQVQRGERPWWRPFWGPRRPHCALICWTCKVIVGWEGVPIAESGRPLPPAPPSWAKRGGGSDPPDAA